MSRVRVTLTFNSDLTVDELDGAAREHLRYQYDQDVFPERPPGEYFERVIGDTLMTELFHHNDAPVGWFAEADVDSTVEVLDDPDQEADPS